MALWRHPRDKHELRPLLLL